MNLAFATPPGDRVRPAAGRTRADRAVRPGRRRGAVGPGPGASAIAVIAALAAIATLGCRVAHAQVSEPVAAAIDDPVTPAFALADFDSAWSRILHSYYDSTFRGLDWRQVREELRPRAERATTRSEVRAVIREMLSRLGESHFALIPREALEPFGPGSADDGAERGEPGDAGLELRFIGDQLVVSRVVPGGPADVAGIRTGWVVEAIGATEVEELRAAMAALDEEFGRRTGRARVTRRAQALLLGEAGEAVTLRLRDDADRAVTVKVRRAPVAGEPVRVGNLPVLYTRLETQQVGSGRECVGVIRFNVWMPLIDPHFEAAMETFRGCLGIVVDLRGNPGGVGAMAMGISGYFLDQQTSLGVMTTRQGELRFVSNPRLATRAGEPRTPFAGPVAILVDALTASTSEVFAIGMQQIGRARVFGETSAGEALPALMVRLPSQDVLYHAIANFTGPDGTRVEGRGVVPDEVVPLTRAGLLAGRDAPLEAAVRWIRGDAST